jgi:ABC-2 type transport system permease protein
MTISRNGPFGGIGGSLRSLRLLLGVLLPGFFGLYRRTFFFGVLLGFAALALVSYSAAIALLCAALGMVRQIPSLLLLLCLSFTFFFTFAQGLGTVFRSRDNELLMSLPIGPGVIAGSRIITVYLQDLLILTALVLPGLLIYGHLAAVPGRVWPMLLLSPLLGAMIPLSAGTLLGAGAAFFLAGFRRRNGLTIVLGMAALLAITVLSFNMRFTDNGQILTFAMGLSEWFLGYYPPARFYNRGLLDGSLAGFGVFALLSAASLGVCVLIIARLYRPLYGILGAEPGSRSFGTGVPRPSAPFRALYRRELRRFFASPPWVLNTCAGAALLLALGIALCLWEPGAIPDFFRRSATLPFVPALFVVTGSTTAASISLEGKGRWILASLPVPAAVIYGAKIAANLSFLLPPAFLGTFLILSGLDRVPGGTVGEALSFTGRLFSFITPAVYACFTALLGLRVNLRFPKYDWVNEIQPIKQAASAALTLGIGLVSVLIPLGFAAAFPGAGNLIVPGTTLLVALVTGGLCRGLGRIRCPV